MSNPFRANYPLVNENDTLVVIFRDHLLQHDLPFIYVRATSSAQIRVDSGSTLDVSALPAGTPQDMASGSVIKVDLPVGLFDPLKKVTAIHVLRGRVSVEIVAPGEFRAFFQMPTTLSGNTGARSGGWLAV